MEKDKDFYWVGVDCGKNTGVAVWNASKQQFEFAYTTDFWGLIQKFHDIMDTKHGTNRDDMIVAIEDPGKIKAVYKRHHNQSKKELAKIAQNVGGVKRETALVVEFLESHGFHYYTIQPTRQKLDQGSFENRTNYDGATNQHERDAAMLAYGRAPMTGPKLELLKYQS